jgi:hypothetical protein
MVMLNVYKQKSNHQYRKAFIIREDRTQYPFRYRQISNNDLQKLYLIDGLRTQTSEFIIATTDQFEFEILKLSVNIDNKRYKILDAYTENNVNTDGLFRRGNVTTYLRIGK